MAGQVSIEILTWPEALTLLSSWPACATPRHFTVVVVPQQQTSDLSCPVLDPAQIIRLAEFLVAIAGIPDYIPTTVDPPIPLRLDAMLHYLLDQPLAFLPPLLRSWCEWFGLHPNSAFSRVWVDFVTAHFFKPSDLPDMLGRLVERRLACANDKCLYLPLPVAVALTSDTRLPSWDMLSRLLHQLRHALLYSEQTGLTRSLYQKLTAFLRTPHPSLDGHIYRTTRARGALVDLVPYDWSVGAPQPVIDAVLVALQALYESDATRYRAIFNRIHGLVWDTVGQAVGKLEEIESYTPSDPVTVDPTSYADSSRLVGRRLKSVAEAYAVLTELETTLGVDRYLGGQALTKDLSLVHKRVRRIGQRAHQSLDSPRRAYLRQWNLTSIASVILRLLNLAGGSGPLTDYFPNDRQCVVFLLVDALGYTQFQWFLDTVGLRVAVPLAGNVLAWLREKRAFNDTYLLASNLVTITGACLPTIYTGALPRQTGVIGSHMMMEGNHLNVVNGTDMHHKLGKSEVADLYRRNVDLSLAPFTQVARQSDVDVQVFHGGSMEFGPLAEFTYGSLRDEGRVRCVRQADRLFAEALPTVRAWTDTPTKKHLALLYYPLIDHSGHGCGPYTQFQTAELNKLNFIFTHFLVDLAHQAEELFDGRTSLVITADHGMFESATTSVSHRTVRKVLGGKAACRGLTFVYDNRAMYIYGVGEDDLESTCRKLTDFFNMTGLPITVFTSKDPLVTDLLYDSDSPWAVNCPNLILQFHGSGVFYHDDKLPSHMFLYGAHGGISVEETFVPLIHFTLTPDLAAGLKQFF